MVYAINGHNIIDVRWGGDMVPSRDSYHVWSMRAVGDAGANCGYRFDRRWGLRGYVVLRGLPWEVVTQMYGSVVILTSSVNLLFAGLQVHRFRGPCRAECQLRFRKHFITFRVVRPFEPNIWTVWNAAKLHSNVQIFELEIFDLNRDIPNISPQYLQSKSIFFLIPHGCQ